MVKNHFDVRKNFKNILNIPQYSILNINTIIPFFFLLHNAQHFQIHLKYHHCL